MYKNLIAAFILMFTFLGGASLASAQQGIQDGTYNQAPATDNSGRTGGAIDNRDEGFDWRWLLPLLAIPLLFMLRRDDKNEDRSDYQNQDFAGSKGGEATKSQDEIAH